MKKILFITLTFFPYSRVSSLRAYRFCKSLPDFGIIPYVLTAKDKPIDKSIIEDLYSRKIFPIYLKTPISLDFNSPIDINKSIVKRKLYYRITFYLMRLIKDIFLSPDKYIIWSFIAIPKSIYVIKKNNIKTAIVTGDPFSLFIIGFILKLALGCNLILDYRDPWLSNYFYKKHTFIRRLNNIFWQRMVNKYADKIIAVNSDIQKEFKTEEKKIFVIPNGYDSDFFKIKKEPILKNDDSFIFLYAGKFNIDDMQYNPTSLLKAYRLFSDKCLKKTKILILGDVNKKTKEFLNKEGLDKNVEYQGLIKNEHLFSLFHETDAFIQFYYPQKNPKAISSKIFEYSTQLKPIVSINSNEGLIAEFFKKTKIGFTAENDDIEEIVRLFNKIVNIDYKEFRRKVNIEEIEKFSSVKQTSKLAKIILSMRE